MILQKLLIPNANCIHVSGGSRGARGARAPPPSKKIIKNEDLFLYNFVVKKCVLSIFIYNIALQNTDLGVLQKSSKHFLIYIFFLSTIVFPHAPSPFKKI